MNMEVTAKEFGKLLGEMRAMSITLSEINATVNGLRENSISRKEYERRHEELAKSVHQYEIRSDNKFNHVAEHLAKLDAETTGLKIYDAKDIGRQWWVNNIATAFVGAAFTFLVVAITHYLHLI